MAIEERLIRIKAIMEQMDKRLSEFRENFNRRLVEFRDYMGKRLEGFDGRLNHLETEFRDWESRIDSFFGWSIGLTIGVWATVITLMLPILLKLLGVI